MELMLLGRPMSAQRAYEVGFVNAVVPFDELERYVDGECLRELTVQVEAHLAGCAECRRAAAWWCSAAPA